MNINYTTKPIKPKRTYPWVGRHDKGSEFIIVLFTKPATGFWLEATQIISKRKDQYSRYSFMWDEDKFVPCSITLSSL